jgi:hypothetical protein
VGDCSGSGVKLFTYKLNGKHVQHLASYSPSGLQTGIGRTRQKDVSSLRLADARRRHNDAVDAVVRLKFYLATHATPVLLVLSSADSDADWFCCLALDPLITLNVSLQTQNSTALYCRRPHSFIWRETCVAAHIIVVLLLAPQLDMSEPDPSWSLPRAQGWAASY